MRCPIAASVAQQTYKFGTRWRAASEDGLNHDITASVSSCKTVHFPRSTNVEEHTKDICRLVLGVGAAPCGGFDTRWLCQVKNKNCCISSIYIAISNSQRTMYTVFIYKLVVFQGVPFYI